ncbi:MAG: hypothetical protein IPI16_17890, partial [Comamonadaceae bacterium]|nr:hypothetical protein [Comamonadaceae bacterium]
MDLPAELARRHRSTGRPNGADRLANDRHHAVDAIGRVHHEAQRADGSLGELAHAVVGLEVGGALRHAHHLLGGVGQGVLESRQRRDRLGGERLGVQGQLGPRTRLAVGVGIGLLDHLFRQDDLPAALSGQLFQEGH